MSDYVCDMGCGRCVAATGGGGLGVCPRSRSAANGLFFSVLILTTYGFVERWSPAIDGPFVVTAHKHLAVVGELKAPNGALVDLRKQSAQQPTPAIAEPHTVTTFS